MADANSDDPRPAAKKTGRRGKATRGAAKRATESRTRLQSRRAAAADMAPTASDTDDPVMAYAMGDMSLEQLANAQSGGRPADDAPQQAAMDMASMGDIDIGEGGEAQESPRQQRKRIRRQASVAGAIQRLQQAKNSGVISRGRTDHAADQLLAETPEGVVPPQVEVKTPRQPAAESIVRTHAWISSGAGLLSFGFLNPVIVPVVQLRMLQQLCNLYGVKFTEEWGKNIIGALVGTATASSLAVRALPLIGIFAAPATNGATTWALGRVFIQHFESGGTLLNFNPTKLKSYFADYFNAAPPLVTSAS